MIVDDFDILGAVGPTKTKPELVVDTNAVLTIAIASERFETIARRASQVVQPMSSIEHRQLSAGYSLEVREPSNSVTMVKTLGLFAFEAPDH